MRKQRRIVDRELRKLDKDWFDISGIFESTLFGKDWDYKFDKYKDIDPFKEFNLIWERYCEEWNKGKHIVKADSKLFYNTYICQ